MLFNALYITIDGLRIGYGFQFDFIINKSAYFSLFQPSCILNLHNLQYSSFGKHIEYESLLLFSYPFPTVGTCCLLLYGCSLQMSLLFINSCHKFTPLYLANCRLILHHLQHIRTLFPFAICILNVVGKYFFNSLFAFGEQVVLSHSLLVTCDHLVSYFHLLQVPLFLEHCIYFYSSYK